MANIHDLISNLEQCIPGLDAAPLYANIPESTGVQSIIDWLYTHLSSQGLMVYEEWTEYSGYIPELKTLDEFPLSVAPADYIFSIIQGVDWASVSIDPLELPYCIPWLEHINNYLKPYHLRLVDILPFENAYMVCLHDDEALIQKLDMCLELFGMNINKRTPLDQQQVSTAINSIISG